jgi:acetate kinase
MRVIVVNSGSSSIKYEVFALDDCTSLVRGLLERIGTPEARFKRSWITDSGDWEQYTETRPMRSVKSRAR